MVVLIFPGIEELNRSAWKISRKTFRPYTREKNPKRAGQYYWLMIMITNDSHMTH
jgi:hypothetical protein